MSDDVESILRKVAAGELSPEQALPLLDAPSKPAPAAAAAVPSDPVTTVRVKTSYRSVQVVSDPQVAQIHVTGDHSIRQEGSTLVISTAGPLNDEDTRPDHAVPEQAGSDRGTGTAGRFSFSDLPRTIAWARSWREHQLTVRINPALRLELDVTGADVKVTGSETGLHARLVASSLRGSRVRGPLDLETVSSSVKLTALPTGDSRLACESSSVRLTLAAGADVTIAANNRMGRLVLPDRPPSTLPFEGEVSETTIGGGRDRLTLEAVMSSVTVNVQAWGEVPA